ncbi:DsbA family protein [Deinococcus depolymerans]|uniref:DsbA family protein n=2 Tax=Deinococcus depolymerans TaxID=392408 RepID=A0ABN1BUR5_9DEIO
MPGMTDPQTASTQAAGIQPTDVFIDFLCPYAWRGVELAAALRAEGEAFTLRHFSLVQGNHADNAGQATPVWWLTDQPAHEGSEYQRGSLAAFLAAQAAARQGEDAAWNFTLALFRARHEHGQPLNADTIQAAAAQAALDPERLAADLSDDAGLRAALRRDLQDAAEIGVFGTPTFVLPTGEAAYYRFENLTRDPAQARAWWDLYVTVLRDGAGVATIKRARNRPARRA